MTLKETVTRLLGVGTHSRAFETRRNALEEAKRKIVSEHDAARSALTAQLAKLDEHTGVRLSEAVEQEHAFASELLAELVADAREVFAPLVREWRAEPSRACAGKVATALAELLAREHVELGERNTTSRSVQLLTFAFADVLVASHPNVVMTFGTEWSQRALVAQDSCARAARDAAEMYDALRTLEHELSATALAEQREVTERMVLRYAVRRNLDPDALERFDREQAAAQAAAFARSYASAPLQGGVIDGAQS